MLVLVDLADVFVALRVVRHELEALMCLQAIAVVLLGPVELVFFGDDVARKDDFTRVIRPQTEARPLFVIPEVDTALRLGLAKRFRAADLLVSPDDTAPG